VLDLHVHWQAAPPDAQFAAECACMTFSCPCGHTATRCAPESADASVICKSVWKMIHVYQAMLVRVGLSRSNASPFSVCQSSCC
jgi:hypothetical protein